MDGSIPSRASSDAATSRGLRIGKTIKGSAPKHLTASIQRGRRRQILGSFSTKIGLSPNSLSRTVRAFPRNSLARGDSYQDGSNATQSSHAVPADSRIRSFRSLTAGLSQKPRSLSCAMPLRWFGRAHPR